MEGLLGNLSVQRVALVPFLSLPLTPTPSASQGGGGHSTVLCYFSGLGWAMGIKR